MALVTLEFTQPLNVSCQVGDTAYYVSTTTDGGFNVASSSIVEIGTIIQIQDQLATPTLIVRTSDTLAGFTGILSNQFIFFSKDNKANLSSPLGYFASVKFVNDSTTEAELFSVSTEAIPSSK
jgi:hypothetical protein